MSATGEKSELMALPTRGFAGIKDRPESCRAESQWYALWTRSRQEKVTAVMIESLGVPNYLPFKTVLRQWSDRKQKVTVPLFTVPSSMVCPVSLTISLSNFSRA